jgi:amidohydrolase
MDGRQQAIVNRIDELADELLAVSHAIHANPELAFEEHDACALLASTARRFDLPVETGVFTLETAFQGSFGGRTSGPTVAILAEYDALPGIGHACGHNLIATSALGAALGLKAVDDELPGTVRLIGTPAEERGGGKELMARAGAFDGVDAAMMIHPAGVNLATMPCICVAEVEVIYHGRSAHASAMPHKGINALDGLLLAYQAISNLRQHIRDHERIHGIVTEGGLAPNIVPDRAAGAFYVRAANEQDLARLKPRVPLPSAARAAPTWGTSATGYHPYIRCWPVLHPTSSSTTRSSPSGLVPSRATPRPSTARKPWL